MKIDFIKLTAKSVEATGKYVPAAIWSLLVLHALKCAACEPDHTSAANSNDIRRKLCGE